MLAIIDDQSRQYRVQEGDILDIDLRNADEGSQIIFDKVCLLETDTDKKIGTPYISEAKVLGTVLGEVKGPKTISMRFKRRKGVRVRKGHRQRYLKVKIDKISINNNN